MPTYSYACTECDNRFDIVQSFSDDALTLCSECSGKLRKLFNTVGIVFKGSGFYRTDSRSNDSVSQKGSSETTGSDSSGKSEGGAKTDSAAKSESGSATTSASGSPSSPVPAAAAS